MPAKPSAVIDTRVIYCGDNVDQLRKLPDGCVDLIYIDPPFNPNRNYEVFWGETKEKRSFEDRHESIKTYIDYMLRFDDNSEAAYSKFVQSRPVECPRAGVRAAVVSGQEMSKAAQLSFLSDENGLAHQRRKTSRVVRNGRPTSDLVLSSHVDGNDDVFPNILQLYVRPGSVVADITYGKGVFWRNVPPGLYRLAATDLQDGVDCRTLPYEDRALDCVVFDPPYMHTPGGTAHTSSHAAFEKHYRNNGSGSQTASKYHEAVLDLYGDTGRESHRVLEDRGVFIVKCQDEVCANRQRLTHVELIQIYQDMGFIAEDLFVIVRTNRPGVSRMVRQVHARKNHSYFIVLWKQGRGNERWEPPKLIR